MYLRVSRHSSHLVVWAATSYDDKAKHGHWMRGGSKPWTSHPSQLCDSRVMLACPPWWLRHHPELQTGPKCPDCLAVIAKLLTRAMAVLGYGHALPDSPGSARPHP